MNRKLDNLDAMGIVMLLVGIGLFLTWCFITLEDYSSGLTGVDVIGFLASGLIILTSLELIIWMRTRKYKILRYLLSASATLVPFALSFLGLFIGGELSSSDIPVCDTLLGIIIGFGMGAYFSRYIISIAPRG